MIDLMRRVTYRHSAVSTPRVSQPRRQRHRRGRRQGDRSGAGADAAVRLAVSAAACDGESLMTMAL